MNGKDTMKKESKKSTTDSPKPKRSGSSNVKINAALTQIENETRAQQYASDRWAAYVMRNYFIEGFVVGMSYIFCGMLLFIGLNMILEAWDVWGILRDCIGVACAILSGILTTCLIGKYLKKEEKRVRLWEKVHAEMEKKEKEE